MNLKKLEAFIAVLEKRSFSEAAAALKSSQPAVSIKVKSLEEELGIELLDRGHSGIKPTLQGSFVYQAAKDITKRWVQLNDDLKGFHNTLTGTLTIGASSIPGTYLLPRWIKNFRTLYPKVKITVEISDSTKILEKLLNHQIDVGIVGVRQSSSKMTFSPIAADSLVCITPKQFSSSITDKLDFSKLKEYDLVLREEGSGTRLVMEEYFHSYGFSLDDFNPSISIGSTEGVIAAVEAGMGFSFASRLAAAPAVKADRIEMIEGFQPFHRSIYLSILNETASRPIIKEFADFLVNGDPEIGIS
ncbi:selenium metabolism-associated LysR family transcriptional regulator [Peribacillus kribbensis]|uniref:selenium metabolism-associated LysR family transcriptional regulator n=1 Tax=Peribacillus kribbensis TaxID=356658 RepID=UPI0004254D2B|nr:selenium metabolism-associated LysR family transcriptional regulator [Peribacillus kribbensis]